MKKILALILALVLVLSMFTACASKTEETPTPEETPEKSEETAEEPEAPEEETTGEETAEGEPLTISIAKMSPYADTDVQKELEAQYNVKFDVAEVQTDDLEAANLYWATGNSPDVFINRGIDIKQLFRQGSVRSFPVEWLEEYAPDYMNTIYDYMGNGDLELGKEMTLAQIMVDGECVFVPRDSMTNHVGMLMFIRQDWLDALELEVPTTIDELHDVMVAFTNDDPDGDGANDTYGMHGSGSSSMRFGSVYAANHWWPNSYYMDDDGKVTYSSATETCKEMLKLVHGWYEEGIVDPELITDDRQMQRDKWAQGLFGILVDHPWWLALNTPGNVQQMLFDADPNAELTCMEPFADEDGVRYVNAWYPDCISDASMVFGKDCPDETIQLMLTMWNDMVSNGWEYYRDRTYGEEGVDYTLDEDGKIVVEAHTQTEDWSATHGSYYDFIPIGCPREWYLENVCPKAEGDLYAYSMSYEPFYMANDFVLPVLDNETTQKVADVTTIANEFYANAISGVVDIDAEWDSYLESLDAAGLQDVIAAYEAGGVK